MDMKLTRKTLKSTIFTILLLIVVIVICILINIDNGKPVRANFYIRDFRMTKRYIKSKSDSISCDAHKPDNAPVIKPLFYFLVKNQNIAIQIAEKVFWNNFGMTLRELACHALTNKDVSIDLSLYEEIFLEHDKLKTLSKEKTKNIEEIMVTTCKLIFEEIDDLINIESEEDLKRYYTDELELVLKRKQAKANK